MSEPLQLEMERSLVIQPHPTINGFACEVEITGLTIRWQVIVLRDGEGWHTYLAHTCPDHGWSNLLRQRDYTDMGHPQPTSLAELIEWTRWFFDVKRKEG